MQQVNYAAELKRYSAAIYQESNLGPVQLKAWLRTFSIPWSECVLDEDLHTFWYTRRQADELLYLAARAGVSRLNIVRAACACARLTLRFVPPDVREPFDAVASIEAWIKGLVPAGAVKLAIGDYDYQDSRGFYDAVTTISFAVTAVTRDMDYAANVAMRASIAGVPEEELVAAVRSAIAPIELKPKFAQ